MSRVVIFKIIFCIIFLTSLVSVSAQSSKNLIFNNYHLSFQAGYLSNQIYQAQNPNPQGYFQITAKKGGFIGGSLTINPFHNLGLEVGTNICLQNFGYEVQLSAKDFGMNNDFNRTQNIPELYAEMPLAIIPRYQINDKNWLYARIGMTMSWFTPLELNFNLNSNPQNPDQNEELGQVQMRFSANNPYFSALTGFGIQHLTKDKNLVGFSLNSTFGFSNVLEGNYVIWDDEITVNSGSFSSKGNYISFVFSYTFTGAKKLEAKINKVKMN